MARVDYLMWWMLLCLHIEKCISLKMGNLCNFRIDLKWAVLFCNYILVPAVLKGRFLVLEEIWVPFKTASGQSDRQYFQFGTPLLNRKWFSYQRHTLKNTDNVSFSWNSSKYSKISKWKPDKGNFVISITFSLMKVD